MHHTHFWPICKYSMQDSFELILFFQHSLCIFFCQMMRCITKVRYERAFFHLLMRIYSFPKTERRRIPCWQQSYSSVCHVFLRFSRSLNISCSQTALAAVSPITWGCTKKVQVPAKERAHLWKVGSSTKSKLPLHMTLIIGNLLQQWHPESIRTNSCPRQLGHNHFA